MPKCFTAPTTCSARRLTWFMAKHNSANWFHALSHFMNLNSESSSLLPAYSSVLPFHPTWVSAAFSVYVCVCVSLFIQERFCWAHTLFPSNALLHFSSIMKIPTWKLLLTATISLLLTTATTTIYFGVFSSSMGAILVSTVMIDAQTRPVNNDIKGDILCFYVVFCYSYTVMMLNMVKDVEMLPVSDRGWTVCAAKSSEKVHQNFPEALKLPDLCIHQSKTQGYFI